MAFTVVGSLAVEEILPTQSRQSGTLNVSAITLPVKYSWGVVILDMSQITDLLAVITVTTNVANDGVNIDFTKIFQIDLPALASQGCTLGPGGVGLVDQFGVFNKTTSQNWKFPSNALATRAVSHVITATQPTVVGLTRAAW